MRNLLKKTILIGLLLSGFVICLIANDRADNRYPVTTITIVNNSGVSLSYASFDATEWTIDGKLTDMEEIYNPPKTISPGSVAKLEIGQMPFDREGYLGCGILYNLSDGYSFLIDMLIDRHGGLYDLDAKAYKDGTDRHRPIQIKDPNVTVLTDRDSKTVTIN